MHLNFKRQIRSPRRPHIAQQDGEKAAHALRADQSLMQLVFISLEFTAGTFSGNGVYAANQVFSAGSTCLHAP